MTDTSDHNNFADAATPTVSATDEAAVIKRRREALYPDGEAPTTTWGLAFSGGGIRSATFCLGVLQALAQAKFSQCDAHAKSGTTPLLARFDYLSTVSGGGYIGAFFSALFRPRARDQKTGAAISIAPEQAARDAYATLQHDPPGRLAGVSPADPTDPPIRWLRENGRYLAPSGPGDLLYDVTIALRNLLAIHYVAGITLLTIFLLTFSFRYLAGEWLGKPAAAVERMVQPSQLVSLDAIWGSPWFVIVGAWIALVIVPIGVAYWYRLDSPPARWYSPANPWVAATVVCVLAIWVFFLSLNLPLNAQGMAVFPQALLVFQDPGEHGKSATLAVLTIIIALSVMVFLVTNRNTADSARAFRIKITSLLSHSLGIALLILAFAVVETGGQTLYLYLRNSPESVPMLTGLATAIAAIIAAIRQFSSLLAEPGKDSVLSKIPLDVILGVVGVVLLTTLLIAWHAFATYLFFGNVDLLQVRSEPLIGGAQFELTGDVRPWLFLGVCIAATCASGYFMDFVNLSSLQTMYSARLTRAYLGASNRTRFAGGDQRLWNVTEPHIDDDLSHASYYDDKNLGPRPHHQCHHQRHHRQR